MSLDCILKSIRNNYNREKLSSFSQIMAFLCILDCTILPVITVFSSTFGFFDHFDHYAHIISKFIVAPLAAFIAIFNYYNGGSIRKSITTLIGSSIIFHSHTDKFHDHKGHEAHGHSTFQIIYSLIGCCMVIFGNWKSKKCCSHNTDHNAHEMERC